MVRLWLIDDNVPDMWTQVLRDNVRIDRGKKITKYFTEAISSSSFVHCSTIVDVDTEDTGQKGNTTSFINKASELLDYKEGQHINTISVYQHPDYSIQAMYIINKDCSNSTDINYFATITNTENFQIFGKAVFFKIQNEHTVDLPLDDLLNLLINFYYVNGCRYQHGKFETVSSNNYVPEIQRMFHSYKKKTVQTWMVLAETQEMLDKINEKNNTLEDLDNVIWFKVKEYHGELALIMDTVSHNKDSDYRGVFMDINESFIRKVFF
jgi:hypothetical protein